ncbi:MAG TPA: small-conductance mechanosensitive ion channel [Thermoanaerobaculia bacterium]|nr:small-conductance mechanosensitive ion channel [Thermoanaerobaculia bacterium]
MQTAPVVQPTWWDTLVASLYGILGMLVRGLVNLIIFLLIIVVGWFVSSLVAKAIVAVLRKVRFNELMDRLGFGGSTQRMGAETDAAQVAGDVTKWLIRVVVLVVAFAALGIPAFSVVLSQLLLWLPNLAVAIVVLIVGGLAANGIAGLVRGATAGFKNPEALANVARGAVWAFAIVIAVNQVGIASTLVNTLFMGFVGAVALAAGLAFGIGGQKLAAELLDKWYRKGKQLSPQARADAIPR